MIWLLIGYMFLFVHRPFEIWPILGTVRIELLYMIMVGSVWLAAPHKRLRFNALHIALFCFAAAVLFCSLLSPWSDHCLDVIDPYFKFLIYYLMLVTVVQDEENLQRLLYAFLGFMALYMLHSLWEYMHGRYVHRMGIARMVGVDSTRSDPNAFASSILLSLVFVPVLWRSAQSRAARCALAGYLALSVLCINLTGSRGSFVGMVLWAAVVIWQSEWRKTLAFASIAAAPLLFMALPETLQNRFETIINPDAGPKNAQLSSEARIIGFNLGIQLLQDNPLSGIGPGAWRPATGRKLESHNLYGQLMGEMGGLGLVTFAGLLLAYAINVLRIRRRCREYGNPQRDFLYQLAGAVGLGIVLLLFTGNFGHCLFRFNWALYAAFLAIAADCLERRESDPTWQYAAQSDDYYETATDQRLAWSGMYP
ncbi:MAG: O-antigen ligase family protein [Planctomycetia bacterium]|nr:O-antigen ligase family protein [Planctomycetia bacterium]